MVLGLCSLGISFSIFLFSSIALLSDLLLRYHHQHTSDRIGYPMRVAEIGRSNTERKTENRTTKYDLPLDTEYVEVSSLLPFLLLPSSSSTTPNTKPVANKRMREEHVGPAEMGWTRKGSKSIGASGRMALVERHGVVGWQYEVFRRKMRGVEQHGDKKDKDEKDDGSNRGQWCCAEERVEAWWNSNPSVESVAMSSVMDQSCANTV